MNDNYYDYVAQALNKINFESNSFDCDGGMAVLFWTECPSLPNFLNISEVLWN